MRLIAGRVLGATGAAGVSAMLLEASLGMPNGGSGVCLLPALRLPRLGSLPGGFPRGGPLGGSQDFLAVYCLRAPPLPKGGVDFS